MVFKRWLMTLSQAYTILLDKWYVLLMSCRINLTHDLSWIIVRRTGNSVNLFPCKPPQFSGSSKFSFPYLSIDKALVRFQFLNAGILRSEWFRNGSQMSPFWMHCVSFISQSCLELAVLILCQAKKVPKYQFVWMFDVWTSQNLNVSNLHLKHYETLVSHLKTLYVSCSQRETLVSAPSCKVLHHLSSNNITAPFNKWTWGLYNSKLNRQCLFLYCQSNVWQLLPASDYCQALYSCLNCAQRFDYCVLSSSWKLEGAAKHLIYGRENAFVSCTSSLGRESAADNIYGLHVCTS